MALASKSQDGLTDRPLISDTSRQLAKEKEEREMKEALELSQMMEKEKKVAGTSHQSDMKAYTGKKASPDLPSRPSRNSDTININLGKQFPQSRT